MVFSSLTFLFVYFPLVLVVMSISPLKWRNLSLFVLSLIFYGWGEPVYILIMLLSTIVDYINGYFVHRYIDQRHIARRFVIFSIVFNLGMLGLFKYYDFIIGNLNVLGFEMLKPLGLSLPIGISFYTFQTMSYTIDIYRRDADYQKSIISFGTYVAMFPQLIAGPIVRYKDIATQLNHRVVSQDKFAAGIERFMIGLCKKVLLANQIGQVFDQVMILENHMQSVLLSWLGIIAFGFQIYFDFSGYSDMAIGLGKMLGFDFLENFNYPYIASSITDFWRRWHISLSTFFRDYVYIPLGGNRKGIKRQMLNIFIVWSLTGIWHGASWNFLVWGMYFATLLIFEKVFMFNFLQKLHPIVRHLYTLVLVLISWTIFSVEDMSLMIETLKNMFMMNQLPLYNDLFIYYIRNNAVILIALCIASTPLFKQLYIRYVKGTKWEYLKPVLMMLGLIVCVGFLVDATYNPFLYFRF
ncbi:MAG: MBOAT family O-acyltransferase [Erysipelotrichaceae bacterium]